MANKQINYYVENKYTDDIVYPYSNGEEDRYRKTEDGVLLIHKSKKGIITERLLSEWEFPLSDFDRMKSISDENYRVQNQGDVLEQRHTVSLSDLEETKICSKELSAEDEYLTSFNEEDDEGKNRTLENALSIMDACLSEKQRTRMKMYFLEGRSMDEIAESEGTSRSPIRKSIRGAQKKIKKYLSVEPKMGAENASKMYIGEGQENQKKTTLS